MVNIDNENKKLNFNSRISLSGQYSTLTYPVYTNDSKDTSVNPKYFEEIWDIGEDTEVKKIQAKGKKCYFPFKSSVEAEYSGTCRTMKVMSKLPWILESGSSMYIMKILIHNGGSRE